jgi:hypothetical protein
MRVQQCNNALGFSAANSGSNVIFRVGIGVSGVVESVEAV